MQLFLCMLVPLVHISLLVDSSFSFYILSASKQSSVLLIIRNTGIFGLQCGAFFCVSAAAANTRALLNPYFDG